MCDDLMKLHFVMTGIHLQRAGTCKSGNESSGSIKWGGGRVCLQAEDLLASQLAAP